MTDESVEFVLFYFFLFLFRLSLRKWDDLSFFEEEMVFFVLLLIIFFLSGELPLFLISSGHISRWLVSFLRSSFGKTHRFCFLDLK